MSLVLVLVLVLGPEGCPALSAAWPAGLLAWLVELAPSVVVVEEPSDCLFRKPEACWVSLLKSMMRGVVEYGSREGIQFLIGLDWLRMVVMMR